MEEKIIDDLYEEIKELRNEFREMKECVLKMIIELIAHEREKTESFIGEMDSFVAEFDNQFSTFLKMMDQDGLFNRTDADIKE